MVHSLRGIGQTRAVLNHCAQNISHGSDRGLGLLLPLTCIIMHVTVEVTGRSFPVRQFSR
ncbi:hypothetical protein B8W66_19970 [Mycobacterium decipiens]|uniref:Uncharacterized protein n=1 Tax=Mycobacterium decipiens TaxID=1430326 RepID=A0A1X2LRY4_9MYCO|nr:hypothetical protein B8W66_19970 [Mycobacterium decipiens]